MTFWSGVESEYNEIFGENGQYNPESKKLEEEFDDLVEDIKTDVKRIPKKDVWPEFPAGAKEEEEEEDDEYDMQKFHKAMEEHASSAQKRAIKCKVAGKEYEVGDKWKDDKTGKEMICILMNIPKGVRPMLKEADVTVTAPEPKVTEEWTRPSVEPQWEYTSKPKKKTGDRPCKISVKHNSSNQNSADEGEADESDEEDDHSKGGVEKDQDVEKLELVGDKLDEEDDKESQQDDSGASSDGGDLSVKKEPEDVKDDREEELDSDSDTDQSMMGSPAAKDQKGNSDGDDDDDDNDDNKDESDDEEKPITKSSKMGSSKKQSNPDINEDDDKSEEEFGDVDEPYEEDLKSEVTPEPQITTNEETTVTPDRIKERPKQDTLTHEPPPTQRTEPEDSAEAEPQLTQEKGQTLYMKETVIKRRKLIKTETTIETIETEKEKK